MNVILNIIVNVIVNVFCLYHLNKRIGTTGLEPVTCGLKDRYSTIELHALVFILR